MYIYTYYVQSRYCIFFSFTCNFLQACAHRYVNFNPNNRNVRNVFGRCYHSDRSLDDFTEFQPCEGGMYVY